MFFLLATLHSRSAVKEALVPDSATIEYVVLSFPQTD